MSNFIERMKAAIAEIFSGPEETRYLSPSATEEFLEHYSLPFTLREFQVDVINKLAKFRGSGCYMDVGTGKTVVSTVLALWHGIQGNIDRILVVMPPILLLQWQSWFENFPDLDVQLYRGTPAQRRRMPLDKDVTLMSLDIFKRDYERIVTEFADVNTFLIVDEASRIRNIRTDNFRAVRDFIENKRGAGARYFTLLTGTPINRPEHCYAYLRLLAPNIYKSYDRFSMVHIRGVDIFGQPNRYANLDMLSKAMQVRSVTVRADDHLDLPEVTYDRVDYSLSPAHKKLYDELAEEELVKLDDGTLLDGTTAMRLYTLMQRLILMPASFGGETIKPAGFDLLATMVDESGILDGNGEKLIVYAHYRESNVAIAEFLEKIKGVNPVQAYGDLGSDRNLKNVQRFLDDPLVNVLVANPRSIGIGLNLQSVCRSMLFLELPLTADDFIQAVGRIKREGQTKPCLIRFGVAKGTIQEAIARAIVKKEDIVQKVRPTVDTLRSALFGR